MIRLKKIHENNIIFLEGGKRLVVIYVDILIVINLAVDYLLLFGTARLAGTQFIRKKGFLGALTGAVYSLVIFLDISRLFFALTKFAVSAIMVAVTFGKRKALDFIRLLLLFYICGFLFSGFMMLVNSIVHADSFFVKGGIVYFEFSAIGIVLSGTAAFLITEVCRRIFRRGEPEGIFIAKVFFNGKHTVLKCFLDTGNSLCDPLSGTPVAVTSLKSLGKILPEKMFFAIKENSLSTEYKLRMIPCKTVSGSVLILAFRPEKIIFENEKGEFEAEDIMVGVSENAPEETLIIGNDLILKEVTGGEQNENI